MGALNVACICGQVRVEAARRPEFLHACNCTLCRKSGAWWGYFHPDEVTVEGATKGFVRADKDAPGSEIRFCETCGATTHFVLTPASVAKFGNVQMGVNLRLAEEADLAGIELRYPDGAGWAGEGAFGYVRAARVLGES